jgi:heme exporter protein B
LKALLLLQFRLEVRKRAVIISLVLYLLSLVLINYLALGLQQAVNTAGIWSALFWLAILSTAVNVIAKSFSPEKNDASVYLYSIASPAQIIISRIIYGFVLCVAISLAGFVFFATFLTDPIQDHFIFFVNLVLCAAAFSASLTILSAIAAKTNNSSVVMAILSFPILVSILLNAIRITKNAIDGLDRASSFDELVSLAAINLLVSAVSYLLFPYIWRS